MAIQTISEFLEFLGHILRRFLYLPAYSYGYRKQNRMSLLVFVRSCYDIIIFHFSGNYFWQKKEESSIFQEDFSVKSIFYVHHVQSTISLQHLLLNRQDNYL